MASKEPARKIGSCNVRFAQFVVDDQMLGSNLSILVLFDNKNVAPDDTRRPISLVTCVRKGLNKRTRAPFVLNNKWRKINGKNKRQIGINKMQLIEE